MNIQTNDNYISPADRFYNRHKLNMQKYRKAHPQLMVETAKRHIETIKKDPERLLIHLEKRKNYYYNVVVPRRQALRCQ